MMIIPAVFAASEDIEKCFVQNVVLFWLMMPENAISAVHRYGFVRDMKQR